MSGARHDAFVKQARECLKNDQFFEAASFAEQAAELDPKDVDSQLILGAALSKADRPDEAAEAFRAALRINPNSAKAHYNLAVHLYRYGWKEEAAKEAMRARSLDDAHTPTKNLLDRIEREARDPALLVHQPGAALVALPTTSYGPERAAPNWVSQEFYVPNPGELRHGLPFVSRLGLKWELIFAATAVLLLASEIFLRSEELSAILFAVWLAATIIDVMDQRPSWAPIAFAALSMILLLPPQSSPLAFWFGLAWSQSLTPSLAVPIAGGVTFLAYFLATRLKLS